MNNVLINNRKENMSFPKTSYLYSFTLLICVFNTAVYSFKKTVFVSIKVVPEGCICRPRPPPALGSSGTRADPGRTLNIYVCIAQSLPSDQPAQEIIFFPHRGDSSYIITDTGSLK